MNGVISQKRIVAGCMAILFAVVSAGARESAPAAGAAPRMRLRVKVLKSYPQPVITEATPGVEGIKGGYECGNTVKVTIDGQPEYHFFSLRMPGMGWADMGVDQLVSSDGFQWRRIGALTSLRYEPSRPKKKFIASVPAQPFWDEKAQRWSLYYCQFECESRSWQEGSTIWCASSKVEGMKGIRGPWDFPGKQILFPGASYPKESVIESTMSPYQAKDGRWAMIVGGNGKPYEPAFGHWWAMLCTAPTPLGPWTHDEKHSPCTMVNPTGFIENPTVTKIKGPVTGRDYWVSTFDFLRDMPYNTIAFSWSEDGLSWPMEQGELVYVDEGLAPGETGWWKGAWAIRTPHQLIDEGNGTYTVFFTGSSAEDYFKGFRAVGRFQVQIIEEPMLEADACPSPTAKPVKGGIPEGYTDRVNLDDEAAWMPTGAKTSLGTGPEGKPYRHALADGWFSWNLKVRPDQPNKLVCTCGGADRSFDILVDGRRLTTVQLGAQPAPMEVEYAIPTPWTKGRPDVTVRFHPRPGKVAGDIYGCAVK